MANHVIYDRIWESKKLAACSLKAALAYPWIYLAADDWGRFEYQPRVIWGRVFAQREDIRAAEVEAWLKEYESLGLLEKYEVGGRVVCQWTHFSGPPMSRKRQATLPRPDGTIETKGFKPKSRFHSANNKVRDCSPEAGSRKQDVGSKNRKQEQEITPAVAVEVLATIPKPSAPEWNNEFAEDFVTVYGGPPPKQLFPQVRDVARKYGWARTRPVLREYMAETQLEYLAIPKVLAVRIESGGKSAQARASPKAVQREQGMSAMIRGGMRGTE